MGFSRQEHWSVDSQSLLQGISLTLGNLTHVSYIGRQILYPLSHPGSPCSPGERENSVLEKLPCSLHTRLWNIPQSSETLSGAWRGPVHPWGTKDAPPPGGKHLSDDCPSGMKKRENTVLSVSVWEDETYSEHEQQECFPNSMKVLDVSA
ncbi:hypothetical protein R6Z07F_019636 [Ovis aries]